jgi:RNA polymerase sigma factor (sigma-70 family)
MSISKQPNSGDRFCQCLWLEPDDRGNLQLRSFSNPDSTIKRYWLWYKKNHPEFAELCQQHEAEDAIVKFWLNIALHNSPSPLPGEPVDRQQLALKYLSAFLQKACYWAAKIVYDKFGNYLSEDLSYCFTIAFEFTQYNCKKFIEKLTRYDSKRGSLETYFKGVLYNLLRAKLNVGRMSDERLLFKASSKKIREALQDAGEQEPKISCILFTHQFFHKIYCREIQSPIRIKGKQYPKLNLQHFIEIAQYYHDNRKLEAAPPLVFNNADIVTEETIEKWLKLAIEALRRTQSFLNVREIEEEDFNSEACKQWSQSQQDEDESSSDNLDTLVQEQIEESQAAVAQLISSNRKIKNSYKSIPFLYYGLDLSQIQIAQCFGVNQTTIGRHIKKYYIDPLNQKLKPQKQSFDIPHYVCDWLFKGATIGSVGSIAHKTLEKAYQSLTINDREVLKLYDLSSFSIDQVAIKLSLTEAAVIQKFEKIKADIEYKTLHILETTFNKSIENKLVKAYQSKFHEILVEVFKNLSLPYQEYLISRYLKRMDERRIAESKKLSVERVEEIIFEAKLRLRREMVGWMQEHLSVALDTEIEISKLDRVIQNWLERLYQQQSR